MITCINGIWINCVCNGNSFSLTSIRKATYKGVCQVFQGVQRWVRGCLVLGIFWNSWIPLAYWSGNIAQWLEILVADVWVQLMASSVSCVTLDRLLNLFWTAVSSSVKWWWCTFTCQTSITFKWQGPNWHWLKQKVGLLVQVMKSPYTVSSWFMVPMWSRVFPPLSLGSSFLWVGFILRGRGGGFLKSWQRWTPANPGLYQFSKSREFPRDSVVRGKKKALPV